MEKFIKQKNRRIDNTHLSLHTQWQKLVYQAENRYREKERNLPEMGVSKEEKMEAGSVWGSEVEADRWGKLEEGNNEGDLIAADSLMPNFINPTGFCYTTRGFFRHIDKNGLLLHHQITRLLQM